MKKFFKFIGKMILYGFMLFCFVALTVFGINKYIESAYTEVIFDKVSEVPKRKVALVLGTSKYLKGGWRNAFFSHRISAAAKLYHNGKVKKIIVSGDNGNTNYDEPTLMRDDLIAQGVPAGNIVLDYAGFRTFDSVVRANDVFGQNDYIIVSQRFHVERALFIGKSEGHNAVGFTAKDPPTNFNYKKVIVREYLARVKAFLDCYLLGTEAKFPGPREEIQF